MAKKKHFKEANLSVPDESAIVLLWMSVAGVMGMNMAVWQCG